VPFESFRREIEAVVLTPAREKKSNAGRKPIDVIVMFRMLVLQSLYTLSDEQVEYQVRDRPSFTRFLLLGLEDRFRMARRSFSVGRAGKARSADFAAW
jgi:IS5 family transposase